MPTTLLADSHAEMSNILDKPLESVFGYITVLPGAFSAYRWHALQNDALGNGPLAEYFKGEKLESAVDADLLTKNMYLAEDRVLCWELVSKRASAWTLQYVLARMGSLALMSSSAATRSQPMPSQTRPIKSRNSYHSDEGG